MDSYEKMKNQKDAILRAGRYELTRIYDILAGINDAVELGDDGYARFGSVNDRDRLRALVQELEPAALADHGKQAEADLAKAQSE